MDASGIRKLMVMMISLTMVLLATARAGDPPIALHSSTPSPYSSHPPLPPPPPHHLLTPSYDLVNKGIQVQQWICHAKCFVESIFPVGLTKIISRSKDCIFFERLDLLHHS